MYLAIRDLRFAKGRFALMGGVIGLISLLVVLLTGLTAGLSQQSVSAITSLPGDHVAFAKPAEGEKVSYDASRMSAAAQSTAAKQPGVDAAALLGISTGRIGVGDHQAQVSLFGADPGTFLAPKGVSSGHVAVSKELADDEKLSVGDTLTVGDQRMTVGSLVDDASYNHIPVVWLPRADWKTSGATNGADGSVLVMRTSSGFDQSAFQRAAGVEVRSVSDSKAAVGSYTSENGSLTLMRVLLMLVSALVVGAFFTVWTIQRTPDLAVLKAMGAKTKDLVRDALGQALILLAVGGGIGTAVAAGLGLLARSAVPFVVAPSTTVIPLLLLVAVGLVGAVASLRRIATVDPITALGAAR